MEPQREFYFNRTVLVTGGTGFMGKVLLEKMIRSLPDLKRIYVLLRPKKGLMPEERIEAMTSKMPFTFNNIDPEKIRKLVAIHGDVTKDDLGLSSEDHQKLVDEVSVVFHMAASTRMDLSLKDALVQNTISTQHVLNFCIKLRNLSSVVHLSTAYCNVDVEYMDEKVYPIKLDPYGIIEMVQWIDDDVLEKIQENIMAPHPNSYTFSKRVAELVALDMGKKLPLSIGRPSIVVPSMKEPTPGWVDSINGPVGILLAAGKGVMRTMLGDKKICPQIIPVDSAINGLIVMASSRATQKFTETPVYNLTNGDIIKVSWEHIINKCRSLAVKYPFRSMLWYPGGDITTNWWLHNFLVIFCHMIPAYVIDFLLLLFMQKPFLVNVQKRLNTGLKLLGYFTMKKFTFTNENSLRLAKSLHSEDRKAFPILADDYDVDAYLFQGFIGARKFCINEDITDYYWPRVHITILYLLDRFCKLAIVCGLMWLVLHACGANQLLGGFLYGVKA